MKKNLLFAMLLLLLMPIGALAAEEAAPEEKTYTTVGLKGWYNTWQESYVDSYTNRYKTVSSDPTLTMGPTVNIRSGKYFGGATFLTTIGGYKFDFKERTSATQTRHARIDYDRWDLDGAAGYYFHPRVAGFFGYKIARWTGKFKDEYLNNSGGVVSRNNFTRDISLFGPMMGLSVNLPLGRSGVTPFASYSYYLLREVKYITPQAGDSYREDASNVAGDAFELGIAWTKKRFTLTGGYRYQNFHPDADVDDTITGLFMSGNLTF